MLLEPPKIFIEDDRSHGERHHALPLFQLSHIVFHRTKLAENSTSDSTSAKDPEETMPPLKELKSPETSSFNQQLSKLTTCSAA